MWVIDYDHRSDRGPRLVGPFDNPEDAHRYADRQRDKSMKATGAWHASYSVVPLYEPSDEVVVHPAPSEGD